MTAECRLLKLMKAKGLHKGGCANIANCSGEHCQLPVGQALERILAPDINEPTDYTQDLAAANALAALLRTR